VPYLIDGNNVMGAWGGPRLGRDGRAEVVRRVAAFCRSRGARATVVFDGAPLRADREGLELGPVSVRSAPPGGDADGVIRDIVERSPRPAEITVVTSDKALYSYVKTRGALAIRSQEWSRLEREAALHRPALATNEKPQREDDVEGWLKIFGAAG
jgi:predicted RNA-binding protein with PIN domain